MTKITLETYREISVTRMVCLFGFELPSYRGMEIIKQKTVTNSTFLISMGTITKIPT